MADLDFPTSPSVNDTYTDDNAAVWQYDGEKWDVITRSTKRAFKGAKAVLSVDYSLNATESAVPWASTNFDTGSLWSSSNASRFSITENGFYRVNAQLQATDSGSGSSYTFSIRKNGVAVSTASVAPNQFAVFDDIIQLAVGDYVEVYGAESTAAGGLDSATSFFEIVQVGLSLGTGISSWSAFSGARTYITSSFNVSSTVTGISFTGTEYDQNADVLGAQYWSSGDPSKFTIKVAGYYRVKASLTTSDVGGADSYTIALNKNDTTDLESTTVGPSSSLLLDEIYNFAADDFIEINISNSGSVGSVDNTAYLEITRLGV